MANLDEKSFGQEMTETFVTSAVKTAGACFGAFIVCALLRPNVKTTTVETPKS